MNSCVVKKLDRDAKIKTTSRCCAYCLMLNVPQNMASCTECKASYRLHVSGVQKCDLCISYLCTQNAWVGQGKSGSGVQIIGRQSLIVTN